MQYAEVVPNRKLGFEIPYLTYRIPPSILPKIAVGSLIEIPLGQTKTEGMVLKIKRAKGKLKQEKLKSITKLLYEEPFVEKEYIRLAEWMSDNYLAPLTLCLFEMFPLPPKRFFKEKLEKTDWKTAEKMTPPYLSSIGKICQKVILKKQKIIIIAPTIEQSKKIFASLSLKFKNRVGLYESDASSTRRFNKFLDIKNNLYDIVIGSRLAVFLPLKPLGAIIITDEIGGAYKNDRAPRYNLITVAEKLSKLTKSKLILINQFPPVENYFKAKQKRFYLLSPKTVSNPFKSEVIDMRNEFKKGNYSVLSEKLQEIVKYAYKKEKTVILFAARRGAASYIFCRNCGFVIKCPNCDLPLAYHLPENKLVCHHCNFKEGIVSLCPNCQDVNIKYSGTGTQRIENEIKKLLPKPDILRLDRDTPSTPSALRLTPSKIIISTQKLFTQFNQKVPIVAVVSIDPLLNLPDFHLGEEIFETISKLKSLAASLFVVQTYHPDNFIIKAAIKNDFKIFYQKELADRKKFDFPPFSTLIKLVFQHKNNEKAEKETSLFAEKLRSLITNYQLPITLLGPSPCFYHKIRGKYRWQIILKLKAQSSNVKTITSLLKTLPKGWIVDVEPKTLL